MAKTREIKRRIKAVANIKRITKTMQMIATARFQAALKRATASQPYARKITELVGELAGAAQANGGNQSGPNALNHPLLRAPEPATSRQLILVLTSNRGLCGGYNGNILRTALAFIRQNREQELSLEVVGKKGVAFFKFNHVPVAESHCEFTDSPTFDQVERLAERYMAEFSAGRYDAIRVVFMSFQSASRQSPKVLQLLPMSNPAEEKSQGSGTSAAGQPIPRSTDSPIHRSTNPPLHQSTQYDFSPDPATLLSELLPVTVKTQLFQCFNEAVVSEQVARMVAMKSATDAAGKMGKELNRRYNRARQAAITTELSEIIAGAAGLE